MDEKNLYGLSDDVMDVFEQEMNDAEKGVETTEEFIDNCFPEMSEEEKARMGIFAFKFAELFLMEGDEE